MAINNALNTGNTPLPALFGGTGVNTIPTDGQIPIGNGTNYVAADITAGTGITVTPGAGSITIAATGGGGLAWSTIAGTTQTAVVNAGFVVGNAAQTTITLPATAAVGSIVAVQGLGAAGWVLEPNSGQTIQVGQAAAGTSVTSAANYDAIEVVCIVANTTWAMRFGVSSGFTTA
jgi:hypothetical protein